MNLDKEKFYSLIPNYAAVKEEMKKHYHKPTEEETRSFLNFWQEVYDIWKTKNSPADFYYLEEKIKVRKALIEKFGIRS